jgi:hypothetical protein
MTAARTTDLIDTVDNAKVGVRVTAKRRESGRVRERDGDRDGPEVGSQGRPAAPQPEVYRQGFAERFVQGRR